MPTTLMFKDNFEAKPRRAQLHIEYIGCANNSNVILYIRFILRKIKKTLSYHGSGETWRVIHTLYELCFCDG